jgi:hypothetical protein
MNYDKWKWEDRGAGSLFLDALNPRIPPSPKALTQPELIQELAEHDDVYELSKNIAANGFFPSEPLVVIRATDGLVVVEGNRRLAACKLLLQPDLSPDNLKSRFKALSATFDHKLLSKIPILIAPSREAAIPLIIARHTATQIAKWQPAMQAHFYHTLVQSGISIEDIATKFNLKAGEIKDGLLNHNLYLMACRLNLPAATEAIVKDPRKFPLTTLKRIFETPDGRTFFGVEFADDGNVVGKIEAEEFKKGFSRAVSDVALSEVDSRILNSPAEIKKYLAGYSSGETPNLKKAGSFDSTTFMSNTNAPRPAAPKKKKTGAGPILPSKGLIPRTASCNITNPRVQALFWELRTLSPHTYANACTFAFRCFLELSTFCFLEAKGDIAKMEAAAQASLVKQNAKIPQGKPQRTLPPNWTPELSAMLKWTVDPKNKVLPAGHLAKALSQAIHDERDLIAMNLVTHNPVYPASETRLRESYARLAAFLNHILA